MWYHVYVISEGPKVEVWRWEDTESEQDMVKVLETSVNNGPCTITDTDTFRLASVGEARFCFDNIKWRYRNNWETFLHLSENSGCFDRREPDYDVNGNIVPFRDFDYQAGPYDGPDPDEHIWHDMGADEYPTPPPAGDTFWWEHFSIEVE